MNDHDPPMTVRVPIEWVKRAEGLARRMAASGEVRGFGKPTRSMIARLAMMRGLEVLELEFAPATAKKRRRSKSA